jgi:RNA polymerase sigma-70 factor (ECF subfamily)
VDRESVIRQYCEAGQYDRAATRAIEAYGAEIGRFIASRIHNQADAQDIFGIFCEDFWSGLRGFAWRCTLRGWAYTVARHAELRYVASRFRRCERAELPSEPVIPVPVRTTTAPYERTDVKDRFRAIRSRLGDEDRLILSLRVDRDLGWRDIAHVLAGPESPPLDLQREEVRIRKRFQIIKERLRRWAADDGLIPPAPAS